jgi:hypothetical protein
MKVQRSVRTWGGLIGCMDIKTTSENLIGCLGGMSSWLGMESLFWGDCFARPRGKNSDGVITT